MNYRAGAVRPALSIRFPLDKDLGEVLSYTIQLGVVVPLKR